MELEIILLKALSSGHKNTALFGGKGLLPSLSDFIFFERTEDILEYL